jgi:hypothetical protein
LQKIQFHRNVVAPTFRLAFFSVDQMPTGRWALHKLKPVALGLAKLGITERENEQFSLDLAKLQKAIQRWRKRYQSAQLTLRKISARLGVRLCLP